ncbi:MAG: tetratricopeptide repeat protein [Dehalococcoidia bacterium]
MKFDERSGSFEVEQPADPTELAIRRQQASILQPSEPFGLDTPTDTGTDGRDPRVVETLLKQARMEMALGDIAAAVARLTQAVRYDPAVTQAWLLKGRCHCMLGDEDDAIDVLGELADLNTTIPQQTLADDPNMRALDELRHAALHTFHSGALQDARLQLRRRDAAAAVRTLRSVPDILRSDEQFTRIWIYAHERLPRWRVWRRTTPLPLEDAALQSVLEWLLAEELKAVSEVVHQTNPPAGGTRLLAAEKVVLTAEKTDERCAKMALLHSEIELQLAQWSCAMASPLGFDGVDGRLARAASWAAAAADHSASIPATEALAERIIATHVHLSRTRKLFGCRSTLNSLILRYHDSPIRDEGELARAKGLFAAVHAEARNTFGEQPIDARNRALIAEIKATAARYSEKLQITTPRSEQG